MISFLAAPYDPSLSRTWLQSNRCHRDDVADGHSAVFENDPVDDQPQDLLLDLKGWIDEGGANACAERLKPFQEPDSLLALRALPAQFTKPLAQVPGVVLDPATAFLQLIQLDRGGLVGIDQPPDPRSRALSWRSRRMLSRSSAPSTAGSPRLSSKCARSSWGSDRSWAIQRQT
jgi:hypothetical protein